MGIKNVETIAVGSNRNDAAFLFSVVAVFSVLAVVLGQLPGDWVSGAARSGGAAARLDCADLQPLSRRRVRDRCPAEASVGKPAGAAHPPTPHPLASQGFFSSYLTGGVVLVVLAIGSTAPGLLQVGHAASPRH